MYYKGKQEIIMNERAKPGTRPVKGQEPEPPGKKTGFIGTLFMVIFILLLGELLFRVVFPLPELSNFNRIMYTPLKTTPEFEKLPQLSNASFFCTSDPDGAEFVNTLNLYGFRDKDWKIEKHIPRVIFIGDSFVEGFMAKDDETIPVGFAKHAEKDGLKIEVMNFGISATKLHHHFRLMRDVIPLFQPDHVIVVFYENDFPPLAYDPRWLENPLVPQYHSFLVPRVFQVIGQVIKGEPAALAWTRKPFQFFAPVPNPANPWTKREARNAAVVEPRIAKAMREGRFNPFVVNELNGAAGRLKRPIRVKPHLEALKRFAARHNTRLFLVYIPGRLQVSDYYVQFSKRFSKDTGITSLRHPRYRIHALTLARTAKSLSVPFLDLTPVIEEKEQQGIHCYWDYDPHMCGRGYLFTGKVIYSWWKAGKEN
jgi:hypothetical protein